jgi:alpha-maltose-1-phosphate synthase
MRVLVTCDWFLKYAVRQAIALRAAGSEVALLCRNHAFEFANSEVERQTALQEARRVEIPIFEIQGRVSGVHSVRTLPATARSVRGWRPDIVHAQDNHDPRLFAMTRGYPSVVTVHNVKPHLGDSPLQGLRARTRSAWLGSADRVVVHGARLREDLAQTIQRGRIVVIPHGLEPTPAAFPLPSTPAILLLGRLERYKGIPVLVEAMRRIWAQRADVRLIVAGRGPEASSLPADDRIDAMIGYVPEDRLDELLARASLVVLPYLEGSQSGVGSFAVSRGVPVVVSDVGSLPELALDERFVVAPGDVGALARTLLTYIEHPPQLRADVLEHARAHLSWDVAAKKSLDVYADVVETPGIRAQ